MLSLIGNELNDFSYENVNEICSLLQCLEYIDLSGNLFVDKFRLYKLEGVLWDILL